MSTPPNIAIVGGGLAGLSAAVELGRRGVPVTLLEARNRLGGRASSFRDAVSGQLLDNCQHVSMGCCTAFARFCARVGVADRLTTHQRIDFITPDGRRSFLQADPLPAPLHLGRSFLRAHFLSLADKVRIGRTLLDLRSCADDVPAATWLRQRGHTARALRRFWGPVLVSALNAPLERAGLQPARKVFVDGFLGDRHAYELQVPAGTLAELYGTPLTNALAGWGVTLRLEAGVKRLEPTPAGRVRLHLRDGQTLEPHLTIAALPWQRLLDVLPPTLADQPPFAGLRHLEASPITSVHLWYDRPLTRLPHAVLLDGISQWLFQRGSPEPGVHYVQVVISASAELLAHGHEEIARRVARELAGYFPSAAARRLRSRVVTEHAATFAPVPGVDRYRPGATTPLPGLLLAGDYTATGWPATMEGAVRSGVRAAEVALARIVGEIPRLGNRGV